MKPFHTLCVAPVLRVPLVCCATMTSALIAQTGDILEEPRGLFHAIPHFVSTNAPGLPRLAFKQPGDQISAPIQPIVLGGVVPNLQHGAIFGAVAPLVTIDAVSSGNDFIPVDELGRVNPHSGLGWVAFTFSVTDGSSKTGSIMEARRNSSIPVGGDIYGYFLEGSNVSSPGGVPAFMVQKVYLEQGHEHVRLDAGREITAHDAFFPYIQFGVAPGPLLLRTDRFYFSVTSDSAAAINAYWAPFPVQDQWPQVHGADVLEMTWNANAPTPAWSKPIVYRSAVELGLTNQDIDALAVDTSVARRPILMSTTTPSIFLLLSVLGEPHEVQAHVAPNNQGTPIRLVDEGDIDAICVYDPDQITGNPHIGWPWSFPYLTPRLSLSLGSEGSESDGGTLYKASVSGFRSTLPPGPVNLLMSIDGASWRSVGSSYRTNQHTLQWSFQIRGPVASPGTQFFLRAEYHPPSGSPVQTWSLTFSR